MKKIITIIAIMIMITSISLACKITYNDDGDVRIIDAIIDEMEGATCNATTYNRTANLIDTQIMTMDGLAYYIDIPQAKVISGDFYSTKIRCNLSIDVVYGECKFQVEDLTPAEDRAVIKANQIILETEILNVSTQVWDYNITNKYTNTNLSGIAGDYFEWLVKSLVGNIWNYPDRTITNLTISANVTLSGNLTASEIANCVWNEAGTGCLNWREIDNIR
jgi:hypothetical protein